MSWKSFVCKRWKWMVAAAAFAAWVVATPLIYRAVLEWIPGFEGIFWAFVTKGWR